MYFINKPLDSEKFIPAGLPDTVPKLILL